ncbi:MAG: translational GTPase TypA [Clostridiales bacterium]|jgi:GTP-binding protein|nr:translational GTPase TypA [Clostridiales bacterium]
MFEKRQDLRNVAIIAHVDHGKTTLVDAMLRQSGIFRDNEQVAERVMDNNDLEKERGITILAKNTALMYKGIKINIVDTPGHADFGGEVERILTLVDGVVLLVDAVEGCMPQTRYVLKKALGLNKKALVVVNKIDRPSARVDEVIDEIYELFLELGATDEQFEFKAVYASGRDGYAVADMKDTGRDMTPLFDAIVREIPAPYGESDKPLQAVVCNIDYNEYVGRIAVTRIQRGTVKLGQPVAVCRTDGSFYNAKVVKLYQFEGLKRVDVISGAVGDIVCISGIEDINIGETICSPETPEPLKFISIDEPTLSMMFLVNDSPFCGKEGKFVTSRHLRERLYREVQTNVSMRVEDTDTTETFKVFGRGELHLSILIEQMRREGYEFQVSRPEVVLRTENGVTLEPIELLTVDVPEAYAGVIINKTGMRKAELVSMVSDERGGIRLQLKIPARGLIGYRSEMLTDTKGLGIMNNNFLHYEPHKGSMGGRSHGALVSFETGDATGYGLFNAQERGRLFITPQTKVYEGMIVGENAKDEDLVVNVCKKKQLTNTRSSASDDALRLEPPILFSLEQSLEFIAGDELMEVTPKTIRLRKKILDKGDRLRLRSKANS